MAGVSHPSSCPPCCDDIAPIRSAERAPRSPADRWPPGSCRTCRELEARSTRGAIDPEALGELPDLPIPPDLFDLLGAPADIGTALADLISGGQLGAPHRAVIVNLIARIPPESLAAIASSLGAVPSTSAGYGLASVLADLALTRHRMLDELR